MIKMEQVSCASDSDHTIDSNDNDGGVNEEIEESFERAAANLKNYSWARIPYAS